MKPIYTLILIFFIMGCQHTGTSKTKSETASYTELANNGLKAVFRDYSAEGMEQYFAEDYIQHNPGIPTGRAPLVGFLPTLKAVGLSHQNYRIFQDGDFVVMHNTFDNAEAFGAKQIVTFDVFRVENGKLAEHWDAITPRVAETVSGRSQVDGPTKVVDLDKTAENKKLVEGLLNDVLLGKNPGKITEYISQEQYHQHNPQIGDGLGGVTEAFQALAAQGNMFAYHKVHIRNYDQE